jgi:uncharacterized protein DUF4082/PEP-CTERM motif-containing protein
MKRATLILAALASILFSEEHARADFIAIQIIPGIEENNGVGYSLGYEFQANTNMTVTQLGYFSTGSLTEAHNVGIYSADGTLLTEATVYPSASLTANFQYATPLPSVTLTAGQDYWIMGSSGVTDVWTTYVSSLTTNAALTYLQSGENTISGNAMEFPNEIGGAPGSYFGPNFEFTTPVVATPQPSSLTLLGIGAVTLMVYAWRRRHHTLTLANLFQQWFVTC